MSALEIRNQKLAELKLQKERGLRRVPLNPTVSKEFQESKSIESAKVEKNPEILPEKPSSPTELHQETPSRASELSQICIEPVSEPFQPLPRSSPLPQSNPLISKSEIQSLKSSISRKRHELSNLLLTLTSLQNEKLQLQSSIQNILFDQSTIRQSYSTKREDLENSINSIISRMQSHICDEQPEKPKDSPQSIIAELKKSIDSMRSINLEKEMKCNYLKEQLQDTSNEIEMLRSALPSIPEPPPEESLQIHENLFRDLVSDVGSTGNLLKHLEESKGLHYPSPDPHENQLHQSTGETMHILHESDQGAATPPNEIQWGEPQEVLLYDNEESKEPGTPKRDGSLRRNSSGSSTPHRYTDSVHRVHNLLGPSIHSFNSEEDSDFFNALTRESRDKRKCEPANKSLFD